MSQKYRVVFKYKKTMRSTRLLSSAGLSLRRAPTAVMPEHEWLFLWTRTSHSRRDGRSKENWSQDAALEGSLDCSKHLKMAGKNK